MKQLNRKPAAAPFDPIISGAKQHYEAAAAALRTGCAEALITGLHLMALHARSNAGTGHGDRRSLAADDGFQGALDQIGIAKTTAYRWMNAAANGLKRAALVFDDVDLMDDLPDHNSPRWLSWEKGLQEVAQGMSLNRLLLGTSKASTEEHRYDELLSADEEGRQRAAELLQGVADGRYTLVQAVKALGSLEAYDKLKAEGGEKNRRDPVYLDFDPVSKKPVGLIPKAFTTLHNGFQQWDSFDPDARSGMKALWKEVIKSTPKDLLETLKK